MNAPQRTTLCETTKLFTTAHCRCSSQEITDLERCEAMGLLLYPIFDRDVDLTTETAGEFLGRYVYALEAFAERFGLIGLGEFADSRPFPEDFAGSPQELVDAMGPCDDWFDAAVGAEALHSLSAALRNAPRVFEAPDTYDGVLEELENLAKQLEQASLLGARFRLELS